MRFVKGHGTGNDFVILDDPSVELTADLVARLCDRRFGIGGDGVLRVLPSTGPAASWFMDYWNSDGSLSEMCGNGIRVFARYLESTGRVEGDSVAIDTRDGVKTAHFDGDQIRIDMGPARHLGHSAATLGGADYTGRAISMGNPHLVCSVTDVAKLDLSAPFDYDRALFPHGVNLEFCQPDVALGEPSAYRRMRVIERGSGETLSCGTGACAVGAAALAEAGLHTGTVKVDVPGGRLTITIDESTCWLTGPAVLTFTGEITL
ncbi:diaminopimelate epimerase [Allocatelliglobosispora scoriae]|uniref:Diaminopimelate epimerase n=1 Tax=Allocatelliglobosispora scoriae TaxID=643052 RepID=A0A841BTC6_9ACTN|nr:diaminopimelate epimerase [Allocatelliglobosispora scoriae]MBB5872337.1 diaminopimelate epimerase [Allocatelliglobosispora scoriae]